MYEIKVYETSNGNRPLDKFISRLVGKHKDDQVTRIKAMIYKLQQYGFGLMKIEKGSIKYIGDQIYELRPSPSRIFFFYSDGNEFVLLHGFEKTTKKTPPKEIEKARREKRDYNKEYGK